jgi:perosamine synthetase
MPKEFEVNSANEFIPWAAPRLWGKERELVLDAIESTWISGGSYVDQLELDFATYCGVANMVSSSNGTTALHLALLACKLSPGDEVVVPGFGFMAAANVAIHLGLRPVFSEVDPNTWCMGVEHMQPLISPKTKVIIPIHTYGNMCDMDPILEFSKQNGLIVIEDAAEAIGSSYKGRKAGSIADMGTFSFHATKTITTGEGGAVATSCAKLANDMRKMRSHGMGATRYLHEVAGHNFRLTNFQAAMGVAQLSCIKEIEKHRREIYNEYAKRLEEIPGVKLQSVTDSSNPLIWAVAVSLGNEYFPQGRDSIMDSMLEAGIETRPGFYSASAMPHIYGEQHLPICDSVASSVISLPSSPPLTIEQIDRICGSLESHLKKR